MTILIGVLCQDGVVMGSDSSATFTAGGMKTVEQKTDKIQIIDDKVILMGSGPVGLEQRFHFVVEKYYREGNFVKKPYQEVAIDLCIHTKQNFSSTGIGLGQFGALLAFPSKESNFHLCEFALRDFQPEFKTSSLWYVSMGSGQPIADPFLGFIRKIFWHDTPPICQDGVFYVAWTLRHTIDVNPGGIKGPIQLAILRRFNGDSNFSATLLAKNELDEHIENVRSAEKHFEKYNEMLQSKEKINIPKMPKKKTNKKTKIK